MLIFFYWRINFWVKLILIRIIGFDLIRVIGFDLIRIIGFDLCLLLI